MKRRVTAWAALWCLMLGFSATTTPVPPRPDPGDGMGVVGTPTTDWIMDLLIGPGAKAPWRPMLGTYRLSVQAGEVTLIMRDAAEVVKSGDTRLIPAGVDFGLVNRGAVTAHLRINLSAPAPDIPTWYPALNQS